MIPTVLQAEQAGPTQHLESSLEKDQAEHGDPEGQPRASLGAANCAQQGAPDGTMSAPGEAQDTLFNSDLVAGILNAPEHSESCLFREGRREVGPGGGWAPRQWLLGRGYAFVPS